MSKMKIEPQDVKVMSANEQPPAHTMTAEERKSLVDAMQKELDRMNAEVREKLYIVEGGMATATYMLDYMKTRAKWKFSEAVGVIECVKELEAAIKKIETRKELFLQILPLEAMWFFINKEEGCGLDEAITYRNMLLQPLADALGRAKADRDAINELARRQAALEVGADFEKEMNVAEHAEA
jgi:hypothetical protein